MVISNIGSIVLSLPSASSPALISSTSSSTAIMTSTQVRILSISNTISRLFVGPIADFVSPVGSYLPSGDLHYPRKHRVSRMSFLFGSSILLIFTFGWMQFGIRTQQELWILRYYDFYHAHFAFHSNRILSDNSLGTGVAYGAVFTVLCVFNSVVYA